MASLRTRLFITLLYSWSFEYPLTSIEWIRRLYALNLDSDTGETIHEKATAVASLYASRFVTKIGAYLTPNVFGIHSFPADTRDKKRAISQRKIAEIVPLITLCRVLPWVWGVAVTGSAAVNNTNENDDVDLMMVCAPHRLWLVRPILILFSQLFGKRRTWRGEEGNSWCFNLWMEQSSLQVPHAHRSLYTAYEVCQAQWLVSKEHSQELFITANKWAQYYVPLLFLQSSRQKAVFSQTSSMPGFPLVSEILSLKNLVFYYLQYAYMSGHMTRERVSLHFAAFHPRDTRNNLYQKLGALLSTLTN